MKNGGVSICIFGVMFACFEHQKIDIVMMLGLVGWDTMFSRLFGKGSEMMSDIAV